MTSTLEIGRKKHIQNLQRQLSRYKTRREHQHIGIIVCTGQTSQLRRPAQSRTDALMFIERHSNAIARTAHCYSRIIFFTLHSRGTRMSEVRIITACFGERSEIIHSDTAALKVACNYGFQLETRMITAYCWFYTILKYTHKKL